MQMCWVFACMHACVEKGGTVMFMVIFQHANLSTKMTTCHAKLGEPMFGRLHVLSPSGVMSALCCI